MRLSGEVCAECQVDFGCAGRNGFEVGVMLGVLRFGWMVLVFPTLPYRPERQVMSNHIISLAADDDCKSW